MMPTGFREAGLCFLFCMFFTLAMPMARAEVIKTFRFISQPKGADVYVRRGLKETHIGKTPLTHDLEFHSRKSIARLVFRKKLYRERLLEVTPGSSRIEVKLTPVEVMSSRKNHRGKSLEKAYGLNAGMLKKLFPQALNKRGLEKFDLALPLYFVKNNKQVALVVPLYYRDSRRNLEKGRGHAAKELWGPLADLLVKPVARSLKGAVTHVLVAVQYQTERHQSLVRRKTGTRMIWHGAYQYNYATGGYTYNPFALQEPVTWEELELQSGNIKKGVRRIFYYASKRFFLENDVNGKLGGINVLSIDVDGKPAFKQGKIPDSILKSLGKTDSHPQR